MTKITNSNILLAFRKQMGISKVDETAFVGAFQSIFEEALLRDKILKINGLGSFKLIAVESRKSVNVNTGEEIEIASHNKLTFIPDSVLKDKINEPFAHLETIELDDNPDAENERKENDFVKREYDVLSDSLNNDAELEAPLLKLVEQAEELKDILLDIKLLNSSSQGVEVNEKLDYLKGHELELSEEKFDVKQSKSNENTGEPLISTSDVIAQINKENGVSSERNNWIWIATAVLLFFVIVALLIYQNRSFFLSVDDENKSEIEQVQFTDTIRNEVIIVENSVVSESEHKYENIEDSLVAEKIKSINDVNIYSEKFSDIFNCKREYFDFIDTISLNGGRRLTLVALEYYGHKDYWVYIYEANRDIIKNPNSVNVGTELRIPQLAPELINVSNPETIEYARYLHDIYIKKE